MGLKITTISFDLQSGNGGEGSRLPKVGDGGGFVLEPGCFDIVLLVDNREVIGGGAGGKESRKQVTASQLQERNVGSNEKEWTSKIS